MAQQPKAATIATSTAPPTRDDTPWPSPKPASTNLFVARATWPIPLNVDEVPTPTFIKTEKSEVMTPPKIAAIPHTLILNIPEYQTSRRSMWMETTMPHLHTIQPTHKTEDTEEHWNSERQGNRKEDQSERNFYPTSPQYCPSYDFPDRLSHPYKMEKDRNERLEFLNYIHNLDYYSDSDSESDSEH